MSLSFLKLVIVESQIIYLIQRKTEPGPPRLRRVSAAAQAAVEGRGYGLWSSPEQQHVCLKIPAHLTALDYPLITGCDALIIPHGVGCHLKLKCITSDAL